MATRTTTDHRRRLLQGLAESLREKGLQRTQISDIVARAHTSRRTFYECFPDKESAFVELIRDARITILGLVEAAIDPTAPWQEQVDRAIDTYLGALTEDPALTTVVSRELATLGERGAELQHEAIERFAHLLVRITAGPGMQSAGVEPVTLDVAVMLLGGIAELIARAMHDGAPLTQVGVTAKVVVKAVIEPRQAKN